MSSLEKLKQDMDEKRETADDAHAYAAYDAVDAVDAADAAYVAAKKKYEAALEPATSSERVSISREDAKDAEILYRASAVRAANHGNRVSATDFEKAADRIKAALEKDNGTM